MKRGYLIIVILFLAACSKNIEELNPESTNFYTKISEIEFDSLIVPELTNNQQINKKVNTQSSDSGSSGSSSQPSQTQSQSQPSQVRRGGGGGGGSGGGGSNSGGVAENLEQQITICHYPPGNPDNQQEITIGISAWPAHQEHGDIQGGCSVNNNNSTNSSSNETIPQNNQTNTTILNQTDITILKIKGRYINAFTGEPVPNIEMKVVKSPSDYIDTFYADNNGFFNVTINTTDITQAIMKVIFHFGGCYHNDAGIAISRYPIDGSRLIDLPNYPQGAIYVSVNPFDLTSKPTFFAVTGTEVDVGNFLLWPATDISVKSDIPVAINIAYPEEKTGVETPCCSTRRSIKNVIPLNYSLQVLLTESNSSINYYSPYISVPTSNGCKTVGLNFFNKEFEWNITGD